MGQIQLTSERIGSLFTLRDEDWRAIAKRVALVDLARAAAPQIAKSIPPFPALVEQCERWRFDTFPSLVRGAHMLARWAALEAEDFTRLQEEIRRFSSHPVLVDLALKLARHLLPALARETKEIKARFDPLLPQVRKFANCNFAVDDIVRRNVGNLGPEWRTLADETSRLDHAAGTMLGELQAVTDDLEDVARGKFDIDMQLLLELQIESAIGAWRKIEKQASAFAMSAREAA